MRGNEPLYRRINTRTTLTHGVRHEEGGEYRWVRHRKNESVVGRGSMCSGKQNGHDYTPLYKYLISRVGHDWDEVFREAAKRLDRSEPIFRFVAQNEAEKAAVVRTGENTWFSGLFIDENNRLAIVDPNLQVGDFFPTCPCCTHSFNGTPFVRKFVKNPDPSKYEWRSILGFF